MPAHDESPASASSGLRPNVTQPRFVRQKTTQPREQAHIDAADLFDQALNGAGISNQHAAGLLGVSESMVARMRAGHARERISFVQILKLGPRFHFELHRAMNRKYGYGKAALTQLLEAAGALALVIE